MSQKSHKNFENYRTVVDTMTKILSVDTFRISFIGIQIIEIEVKQIASYLCIYDKAVVEIKFGQYCSIVSKLCMLFQGAKMNKLMPIKRIVRKNYEEYKDSDNSDWKNDEDDEDYLEPVDDWKENDSEVDFV
ncbi:hypothetical protein B9Z55_024767 [Caenorhabditis nigoni]|uniref:Uncharacterized protein n=1 Tax=Caenorhabditis nigoni TaxID=1611254 RepID=A0A2G5SVR3_9PELO|nr:hypothetical protein B9Z55_024767 [Caenorhabditis nigoni]